MSWVNVEDGLPEGLYKTTVCAHPRSRPAERSLYPLAIFYNGRWDLAGRPDVIVASWFRWSDDRYARVTEKP